VRFEGVEATRVAKRPLGGTAAAIEPLYLQVGEWWECAKWPYFPLRSLSVRLLVALWAGLPVA
jgi:hypothetical protein